MELSRKYSAVSGSPTLIIDSKFKAMKADGIDVVGFGAGEPDFDTPRHIKDAAIEAINTGFTKYTPASGIIELKKAIVDKFERENGLSYATNQIVVSNGAKHSLINTFGAILNPGDEVILPAPFWVSYIEMIKLSDGTPVVVNCPEENNFKLRPEELENAITPKTKALVLNSPSNPTGMVYTKDELRAIAEICVKHNIFVVSDEIYEHLIYEGERCSIASFGDDIKNLTIIINGLSKTYAMTGWRIGYLACAPEIAKIIGNVQSHETSNPNSIAQYAAVTALNAGLDFVDDMKAEYMMRRDYMVEHINAIDGVSCLKPQGAFYVMMNIKNLLGKEFCGCKIESSMDFADALLSKALVALVPGEGFACPGYLRWSYATSSYNIKRGIERLQKFLNNEY
ncbi:MAG: pyridoxal phosphate-dependent aminotransferase [Clostridia bacterium]|nr:pyridoxal phosphate-dependent aminotransferase [Clostridia bacterium]